MRRFESLAIPEHHRPGNAWRSEPESHCRSRRSAALHWNAHYWREAPSEPTYLWRANLCVSRNLEGEPPCESKPLGRRGGIIGPDGARPSIQMHIRLEGEAPSEPNENEERISVVSRNIIGCGSVRAEPYPHGGRENLPVLTEQNSPQVRLWRASHGSATEAGNRKAVQLGFASSTSKRTIHHLPLLCPG